MVCKLKADEHGSGSELNSNVIIIDITFKLGLSK